MKLSYIHKATLAFLLCVTQSSLQSASLDGTSTVHYQSGSYPFSNGDFARGFVRLDGGFSVPAGGVVTLNMVAPVANAINLNDTGTVLLEGDLLLASDASFAAGGVVDGQGYAIVMQGDMNIPANASLEFVSNTIIDGMGHHLTLNFDGTSNGGLYINGPAGTRVTLRNLHLHGVRDVDGNAAISFGANAHQVIVLEDVTLHLSDDFTFAGGGIVVCGDVYLKGRYEAASRPALVQTEFNYIASSNLTIVNDATFHLDTTVKFSYAPINGHSGYFKLKTDSSCLSLEGTTLFVPGNTGLILTGGHLRVDHNSYFQGDGLTTSSKPIQLGGYTTAQDLAIDIYPGAQLQIDDTLLNYQNQT